MALSWIKSENFEASVTNFTSTSGALIDVAHYSALASAGMVPWRGAYGGRIRLAGGTTSQYFEDTAAFDDLTSGVVRFLRFYFYLGKDLVMADTNKFSLLELESTVGTVTEVACGIDRSGNNIRFWFSETAAAAASTFVLGTITTALGRWYHAELRIDLDAPAAGDGTIDAWIDDAVAGAQIASLVQAAIVDGRWGVIGPDAGTSGTILLDDFIYDDTRIYRDRKQYRDMNAHITAVSDHPIVGPGKFAAAITDTGALGSLTLYDSDGVPNRLEPLAVIRNVSASEFTPGHDIFEVHKGLYTVLAPTTVGQAFISITSAKQLSDATMINAGLKNGGPRT